MKISRRAALRDAVTLATLGAVSAAGFVVGRHREDPEALKVPAVMIVMDRNLPANRKHAQISGSTLLAGIIRAAGYEFRVYDVSDDLFQEAEWARSMHKAGIDYGAPCVVFIDKDGKGTCHDVPNSIDDFKRLVGIK